MFEGLALRKIGPDLSGSVVGRPFLPDRDPPDAFRLIGASVASGLSGLAPMLKVTPRSPRTIRGPMVTILFRAELQQQGNMYTGVAHAVNQTNCPSS